MTDHNETPELETEGELQAREAQVDSPFGGYGRPFSDDPLRGEMSDAYNHDNPANNVGPYSGPNSYSINTVAPYGPPHQDEENPGQNVGEYDPPRERAERQQPEDEDAQNPVRQAFKEWQETAWFDGTSTSIYARSMEAQHLLRQASAADDYILADELEEQIDVLNRTAAEYDDSSLHEALDNVPGGTVALEYDDLVDGGLVDVTSFLSTASHAVAKEAAEYDWDKFKSEGARQWITQRIAENPGLIKHEVIAREAAVDYAKDKTMVLMDPSRRADIIDAFVTNAERFRRDAAGRMLEDEEALIERARQIEAARTAQVQVDSFDEEFLPGAYTDLTADYDEDGYLALGEDDGTELYSYAREVVESSKQRKWEDFTTEGAREWFFDSVVGSPMAKHSDITFRAARKYASEQATLVPNISQREEIVRAFTESVEFLRQAHIVREARRETAPEQSIDEYFGDEQLW